ncbi:MAG: flagellar biosynthetic protein FliO [Chlamydiota bacterium]|nr:flagellar biosynthetic protein FliO [Chlamydiota bacterium]
MTLRTLLLTLLPMLTFSLTADDQGTLDTLLPPDYSYGRLAIKMGIVLTALLLLGGITIWLVRKIGNDRMKTFNHLKSIKIVERRPLSAKSMLYLVEVGGKQVLLAESQLEVRRITSIDWLQEGKDL